MRRLLPLLGCLTLLVMMWTGGAAHAAEALGCASTSVTEASVHFDGDDDQVPADSGSSVPHHHGGCHGHHASIPLGTSSVGFVSGGEAVIGLTVAHGITGTEPDRALRPPIA